MNQKILFLLFVSMMFFYSFSQELRTISWGGVNTHLYNVPADSLLDFKESIQNLSVSQNNVYFEKIPISNKNVDLNIFDVIYLNANSSELEYISKSELTDNLQYHYYVATEKKQHYLFLYLVPFRKSGDIIQKVKEFKFEIHAAESDLYTNKIETINNSILSTGNWYKIGVSQTGLHKIDGSFFASMGVDIASINPENIRLYGNEAGMLEEGLVEIDDLLELAITVVDQGDNSFDTDDYVLFFGQSPDVWRYDGNQFIHTKNIYTDMTYYFVSFDIGPGKRIETIPHNYVLNDPNNPTPITSFDKYFVHEQDNVNLVSTGRQWFGESFAFDFYQNFNTPIWSQDSLLFTGHFAARSSIPVSFSIDKGSYNIATAYIPAVPSSSNDYYKSTLINERFVNTNNSSISLNFNNNGNSSALAWLDYFTIQGRSDDFNVNPTSHFLLRDTKSVSEDAVTGFKFYKSSGDYSFSVYDVTDPLNIKKQLLASSASGLYSAFNTNTSYLKEFLVYASNHFTPEPIGLIPNQNIHGAVQPDYIIVTHPNFLNAANRLKEYHVSTKNQNVLLVTTDQVYNEFSTGSQDISAIRNMVKMFYDRASNLSEIPLNLLLFGDASFDYKNKLYGVSNFVPTFESFFSSSIESSYCTDDYFGMLDDNEGLWDGGLNNSVNTDLVDIGIGRIPVQTLEQAESFVDKILLYDSNPNSGFFNPFSTGDWKNKICFVADDVDAAWEINLVAHADALAEKIDTTYSYFNLKKIYIDSYQQSLLGGAQRYPDAQEDLVNVINDGVFMVNYVGHGGEVGWASERILELSDINNFTNINQLPVFITATCEFTRYDDPSRISAGEYLVLNPNGGAIGLYSTSRTVAESPTYYLVDALYNYLPDKNLNLTFGESLMHCKNDPSTSFNSVKRKFSFFGDPNLKLSHPQFNVNTLSVELLDSLGQVMPSFNNDTIKALSHVKVNGQVISSTQSAVGFNGVLDVTVFDKESGYTTLNNDGLLDNPFQYTLQNNIIYNGKVEVNNGFFSFEFIVPKDINYQFGQGKLSYYASDDMLGEATGAYENISIGGISDINLSDFDGPVIQLFLNDTNFVTGGYTNNSPTLLAFLFDESGINTVGTGIGHDLTAVLNEDMWGQYILNDYYESDLNSYQSGHVRFPFSDLEDGEHSLKFKAWDVFNNSSEMELLFYVSSELELSLFDVLNYPNPSSSFTQFMFEHNRPDDVLDVRIDIFSLSGQLIHTLSNTIVSTGFRNESMVWHIDESVERGIYVYKVFVKSKNDNSISEKTEKLIILR